MIQAEVSLGAEVVTGLPAPQSQLGNRRFSCTWGAGARGHRATTALSCPPARAQ